VLTGLNSCEKNNKTLVTKSVEISMGASYSTDIYYRLSDGLITEAPRTNWDIAFSVPAREAAIIINSTSGVVLKAFPVSEGWLWETPIDTAGYSTWTSLTNSDTTWTEGAFNANATGHPNYGWGIYNEMTHNLTGISLYIIKLRDGSFRKIWIENKQSADQQYTFRCSSLDGSNEMSHTIFCSGKGNNFVYFSLESGAEVLREPDSDKWDILFTKYIDNTIDYTVTGVLQNSGVTALESTDIDPASTAFPSTGFKTEISTIGYDWKEFDGAAYVIDETRVFFVKDQNNSVYRIRFKTFEGFGTGNLSFDISTY
jgi:hypothetical protein